VYGLIIKVSKTNGHVASSNEMFGTLISGIGLNNNTINSNTNTNKIDNITNDHHNNNNNHQMI
jgi:hypothetical protein